MKHIHILGMGGTFMGGMASIAHAMGYTVTGSDHKMYPPMSMLLAEQGIQCLEGYDPKSVASLKPDCVVVGNALSRGNPVVEWLLEKRVPMMSGPQWLYESVLKNRWVLAVAGTHGKTTTSSMLTWILEYAGHKPGFLIGGAPAGFKTSARLGDSPYFVIEADEYDTAFFDKRSKFVHYWPKTCIVNNLEFDHADIFNDLSDIQKQFHHLVRMLPKDGLLIHPNEEIIQETLNRGCWTPCETIGLEGTQWRAALMQPDGGAFEVYHDEASQGLLSWGLIGEHNVYNALAAMAAAHHVGVVPKISIEALSSFESPKRRLELKGVVQDIHLYDDFAHHPTAIQKTLEGLKAKVKGARIGVLLDVGSNSMRMGVHQGKLLSALESADRAGIYQSGEVTWPVKDLSSDPKVQVFQENSKMVDWFRQQARANDHWVIMSNGSFNQIADDLLMALSKKQTA